MLSTKGRCNGVKGLLLESIRLRGIVGLYFFKVICVRKLMEMLNWLQRFPMEK